MRSSLVAIAVVFVGCRTWQDSWQPVPTTTGKAWHNDKFQQTAFDTNGDGRIDRLRFWRGSGFAQELHDNDFDGWFDELVSLTYEEERSRKPERILAPDVPVTGSKGPYDRPE